MTGMNERSARLGALSPTSLADLRACPRRVALKSQQHGGRRPPSSAASLGIVAHRALELLLSPPPLLDSDWGPALRRAWEVAARETGDRGDPLPAPSPARRTLARLERVGIPAVRALLDDAGSAGGIRCEVRLNARGGRLIGRADAVISSGGEKWVIDWKTGLALADGEARASYVEQMRLYAAMVHEAEGTRPARAVLISLREGAVEVDVNSHACDAVADEALALLEAYDAGVPGPQRALPSPSTCAHCPVSALCDGFWSTIAPAWSAEPSWPGEALRGVVSGPPEHSAIGSSAVPVTVQRGTVEPGEVLVAGVPSAFSETLELGARVAAVGLLREPQSGQLRVGERGQIVVTE